MIHNVVDFRGVKVRDVMLPLPRVVAVEPNASIEEALDLSASSGVDRLPVITPEEQPVGLVHCRSPSLEPDAIKKAPGSRL